MEVPTKNSVIIPAAAADIVPTVVVTDIAEVAVRPDKSKIVPDKLVAMVDETAAAVLPAPVSENLQRWLYLRFLQRYVNSPQW